MKDENGKDEVQVGCEREVKDEGADRGKQIVAEGRRQPEERDDVRDPPAVDTILTDEL